MPRRTLATLLLASCCLLALTTVAWAIRVTLFGDTDTFIERAKDIVIVEVTGATVEMPNAPNGLYAVDVDLLATLKGDKVKGKTKMATIYPVAHGQRYLVSSLGGSAQGTDLLAVPELSLVALGDFDQKKLEGKSLKEQVTEIFTHRLESVVREQEQLAKERSLLERATGIKHDQ